MKERKEEREKGRNKESKEEMKKYRKKAMKKERENYRKLGGGPGPPRGSRTRGSYRQGVRDNHVGKQFSFFFKFHFFLSASLFFNRVACGFTKGLLEMLSNTEKLGG